MVGIGFPSDNRATLSPMVWCVDLLQSTERRMWNDTLVVFQTDNGGPSFAGGLPTANNFPHKGTKSSNWVRMQEIKYYAACSE